MNVESKGNNLKKNKNAFENVVCKMAATLFNLLRPSDAYMRQ